MKLRRYGIAAGARDPSGARAGNRHGPRLRSLRLEPPRCPALILAAKIRAILDGRYHVAREDLQAVAPAALRHRLILNSEGQAEGIQTDQVIADALESIESPVLA